MTKKTENKRIEAFRKYLIIVVGSFLMALAINLIYEPLASNRWIIGTTIVVKDITQIIWKGGVPYGFLRL